MDNTSIVPSDNENTLPSENVSAGNTQLQQQKEEVIQRIPIYQEDYDISKEITNTQLHLEKKWINSTKNIEIPVKYEEMFINGKEFDSYSKSELVEVFSKIKEKISEVIHPNEDSKDGESASKNDEDYINKKQYRNDIEIKHKKNEERFGANGSLEYTDIDKNNELPLEVANKKEGQSQLKVYDDDKNTTSSTVGEGQEELEEQVVPLWGEQIIVDKKMVKLGEIIIRKYKVSENRKIDVDIRNEKVTVKYPDGKNEEFV